MHWEEMETWHDRRYLCRRMHRSYMDTYRRKIEPRSKLVMYMLIGLIFYDIIESQFKSIYRRLSALDDLQSKC